MNVGPGGEQVNRESLEGAVQCSFQATMEQYLELKEKYFGLVLEAGELEQELKDIEVQLVSSRGAGTQIPSDCVWRPLALVPDLPDLSRID